MNSFANFQNRRLKIREKYDGADHGGPQGYYQHDGRKYIFDHPDPLVILRIEKIQKSLKCRIHKLKRENSKDHRKQCDIFLPTRAKIQHAAKHQYGHSTHIFKRGLVPEHMPKAVECGAKTPYDSFPSLHKSVAFYRQIV